MSVRCHFGFGTTCRTDVHGAQRMNWNDFRDSRALHPVRFVQQFHFVVGRFKIAIDLVGVHSPQLSNEQIHSTRFMQLDRSGGRIVNNAT